MELDTKQASREMVAYLIAESRFTLQEISDQTGIPQSTISYWKKDRDFMVVVDEHRHAIRSTIRANGISVIENRVAALNRRWRKLERIIEARAAAPEMQEVPGGDTGLLAHTIKSIGSGPTAERVDEYNLDAALLSAMLNLEQQAAKELGQWEEKHAHQHTGANGGAIKIKYDLSKLTKEDWLAIRAIRERTHCLSDQRN